MENHCRDESVEMNEGDNANIPYQDPERTQRSDFFSKTQSSLAKCKTFQCLRRKCVYLEEEASRFVVQNKSPTLMSARAKIDGEAMKLKYKIPDTGIAYYPVVTESDGDCLLHCASIFSNMTKKKFELVLSLNQCCTKST